MDQVALELVQFDHGRAPILRNRYLAFVRAQRKMADLGRSWTDQAWFTYLRFGCCGQLLLKPLAPGGEDAFVQGPAHVLAVDHGIVVHAGTEEAVVRCQSRS